MERAVEIISRALNRHRVYYLKDWAPYWSAESGTADVREIVKDKRVSVEYDWTAGRVPLTHSSFPTPETVASLRRILHSHFPGKEFLYLGPFKGYWHRAVEEALGRRVPALDATRRFLRDPVDPYNTTRLKYNRDVWDFYPLGTGLLAHGGKVRITYEFTPCLSSIGFLGCLLESMPHGGFVYMYYPPFHSVFPSYRSPATELKKVGAKYYLYHIPAYLPPARPEKVEVVVVRSEDNPHLVLAGSIYSHTLRTSPLRPVDEMTLSGEEEVKATVKSLLAQYPSGVARDALRALAFYLHLKGPDRGLSYPEYREVLSALRQV